MTTTIKINAATVKAAATVFITGSRKAEAAIAAVDTNCQPFITTMAKSRNKLRDTFIAQYASDIADASATDDERNKLLSKYRQRLTRACEQAKLPQKCTVKAKAKSYRVEWVDWPATDEIWKSILQTLNEWKKDSGNHALIASLAESMNDYASERGHKLLTELNTAIQQVKHQPTIEIGETDLTDAQLQEMADFPVHPLTAVN